MEEIVKNFSKRLNKRWKVRLSQTNRIAVVSFPGMMLLLFRAYSFSLTRYSLSPVTLSGTNDLEALTKDLTNAIRSPSLFPGTLSIIPADLLYLYIALCV